MPTRDHDPQPIWQLLRQDYDLYPPAVISLKVIAFPHVADCYTRAHEILFGVCGFRQRSPEPLDGYITKDSATSSNCHSCIRSVPIRPLALPWRQMIVAPTTLADVRV
jgi:hypothetical protein